VTLVRFAAVNDGPDRAPHGPAGKRGFGELVAASLVGGVIGAAFAVGADIYWRQPPADYESRLAALEMRPRPAPAPTTVQPASEALERRVAALEGQTRNLSEAVSAARSAAEASQKRVSDLASRPVAAAAAPRRQHLPRPILPFRRPSSGSGTSSRRWKGEWRKLRRRPQSTS
jgi:hypothetical protein